MKCNNSSTGNRLKTRLRHFGAQLRLERHCLFPARASHVQRGLRCVSRPHSHVHLTINLVKHSSHVFGHLRIAGRDESGFVLLAQRDHDRPLAVKRVGQRHRQWRALSCRALHSHLRRGAEVAVEHFEGAIRIWSNI